MGVVSFVLSLPQLILGQTSTANPSAELKLPYPNSEVVTGIELDWSTHKRSAPGSDNFQLAWADDDQLYGAWGDGGGFGGTNSEGRVGLGIARVEGSGSDYRGVNIWGGVDAVQPATFEGKSWGMISISETLYMWLVPDKPEGKSYRNHYEYIELARSTDHGKSWEKANWRFDQADWLTIPTFLNFGRDNDGVPTQFGDYVFTYFIRPESTEMEQQGPNGRELIVHRPGELYLARVRPAAMFSENSAYEFFAGLDRRGEPRWGSIHEKRAVFSDPRGVGWCLAASYHPVFKRVILTTQHDANRQGAMGIFDAPNPWGPWSIIEYYESDRPFGFEREGSDLPWKNNVFFIAFPTKWFDGTRFTLNFTGAGRGKDNDSFNTVQGRFLKK